MKKIISIFLFQAFVLRLCVAQETTFSALFQKSQTAYEKEEYEQAMPMLAQAQGIASNDAERSQAALLLGQCHLDLGDYPKAIPLLRFAVAKAQDNTLKGDALVALAWALHVKGHPDSSQVLIEQAKKTWNNAFPDAEREVHWSSLQGMIWIAMGKEKEPLELFKQAKARIEANPKAVSAYEQARLYAWLAGRYSYFGWEGSKRTTLAALRKAMAEIPKQEIRWGHIALDASGLFEYKEDDAISKRLEEVYTRRLGAEHLLVVYAKQNRLKYLENEKEKERYINNTGKIIAEKLGKNSIQYILNNYDLYVANILYPTEKYIMIDSMLSEGIKQIEINKYYKARLVSNFLIAKPAFLNILKDTSKIKWNDAFGKYEKQVITYSGKQSIKYIDVLELDINHSLILFDTTRAIQLIQNVQDILKKSVGDSSSVFLYKYYNVLYNLYHTQNRKYDSWKTSKIADSLAIIIFGKDSYKRVDFLTNIANNVDYNKASNVRNTIKIILTKDTIMGKEDREYKLFYVNLYLSIMASSILNDYDSTRVLIKEINLYQPKDVSTSIHKLLWLSDLSLNIHDYQTNKKLLFAAKQKIEQVEIEQSDVTTTKTSFYENFYKNYLALGMYDSAKYYLKLSNNQKFSYQSNAISKEATYKMRLINLLIQSGAPTQTLIDTTLNSIDFFQKNSLDNDAKYSYFQQLSNWHYDLGKFDLGKYYAKKSLNEEYNRIVNNKAWSLEKVNYWTSRMLFNKLYETHLFNDTTLMKQLQDSALVAAKSKEDLINVFHQISAYWRSQKQYKRSINWSLKKEPLIRYNDYEDKIFLYDDLGMAYNSLNQKDSANFYFEKTLSIIDSVIARNEYKVARLLNPIIFLAQNNQPERAITTAHKGIAWLKGEQMEIFDEKKVIGKGKELPKLYDYLAWAYRKWYDESKKKYKLDSAYKYSNFAINTITLHNKNDKWKEVTLNKNDTILSPKQLLDSAYKYSNFAHQSIKAQIKEAILTDKNATENLRNADVKLMYHEKMQIELRYAEVEQKRKDYWQREAYKTCNSSKASGLLQAIRLQNIPIPKDVLADAEAEKKTFREIIGLEKALDIATGPQPEQEQRLKGLYEKRTLLLNNIKQKNRKFYDLRYEPQDGISMAEVQQKLLQPNQILVEYFMTDSLLTTFVIRKDSFFVKNIARDIRLSQHIKNFTQEISKQGISDNLFRASADTLYQILFAPIRQHLNQKELVIITDGELSTLNFEAFLSRTDKEDNPHYLIEDFIISSNYSVSTWQEMLEKKIEKSYERDVTIVLPSYVGLSQNPTARAYMDASTGKRGSFDPLQNGEAEGIGIAKEAAKNQFKVTTYKDEQARKDNLELQGKDSRILHFIGHSKSNKERPEHSIMVFSYPADSCPANFLMVKDIYKMSLPCELATLSSCETGVGLIDASEGLITLGRAFATAGCKSMCISLWSVDDAKTKDLMLLFYQNLFQGERKNEALRNAKLKMLNANISPYYWAAFNIYGDMQPLSK